MQEKTQKLHKIIVIYRKMCIFAPVTLTNIHSFNQNLLIMYVYRASVLFLSFLFVFQIFWCALCFLEKYKPSLISKIGANAGFLCLLASIVFAFFVAKWWVVLISLPFIWLIGGFVGGKIAKRWDIPTICVCLCALSFSVMYHIFIRYI